MCPLGAAIKGKPVLIQKMTCFFPKITFFVLPLGRVHFSNVFVVFFNVFMNFPRVFVDCSVICIYETM